MKLSKADAKQHAAACALLDKPGTLTIEERQFVLEHWREDATNINGVAGAFFTPAGLARDLNIEISGNHILDLCAGIGSLAFAAWLSEPSRSITCIEINPEYVRVGSKVLPEAQWIQADVFDCAGAVPGFDCVISNPPFGNVKTHKNEYGRFEYDLIALASKLGRDGVFIIPQMSAPFRYSGRQCYEPDRHAKYLDFLAKSGVGLAPNCGIDTSAYADDWTIKPPPVEIVLGFTEEI